MLFLCITSFHYPIDILRLHTGKEYESVIRDSTFPVLRNTAVYPSDPPRPGSTWISNVTIIEFDDPTYGFRLPPTIFGAVTYRDFKVATTTTSPMLNTLPFGESANLLELLQSMLESAGWKLEPKDKNDRFKIDTAADREQLQAKLFEQAVSVNFYVPGKYSLLLVIKCYGRCDERDPRTAKYLIDVSVGSDYSSQ